MKKFEISEQAKRNIGLGIDIVSKGASVALTVAGIATKNGKLLATGVSWLLIDNAVEIGTDVVTIVKNNTDGIVAEA